MGQTHPNLILHCGSLCSITLKLRRSNLHKHEIHVKYQSSSDFGAILATQGPIQHDGLYYENIFIERVTENAPKLLSSKKYKVDIEKYSLVLVTSTYSCSKCALNAWHNSQNEVMLGFDVDAANVADLEISGSCYTGSAGSGWNSYKSTVSLRSRGSEG